MDTTVTRERKRERERERERESIGKQSNGHTEQVFHIGDEFILKGEWATLERLGAMWRFIGC